MRLNKQFYGILWMVFHCFSVALTSLFIRILSNHDINTFVILFLQNIIAFVMINIWAKTENITDLYKTKQLRGHFIRSVIGIGGSGLFYYCLTILPITEVTAIGFSEPLFAALLAVIILKEKIYMHRTTALIVGFIGTMIVIQPTGDFQAASLMVLTSAFLLGLVNIHIKRLGHTERSRTLLVYRYLFYTILSAIPALYYWKTPSLIELGIVFLLALSLSMSATSLVKSLQLSDITVLSPFRFSKLIFVGIFAYVLFGEVMDVWTVIGSVIVIASVVYIGYRESKIYNKPKKSVTGLTKGAIKCFAPLALLALSACGDTWMGEKEIPLEGERISVITQESTLSVDYELDMVNVVLPAPVITNNSLQTVENIKYTAGFADIQKHEIGKGHKWKHELIPNPVIVDSVVYAMDSRGYVSAHDANDIDKVLWIKKTTPKEYREKTMAGGLGYGDEKLLISTGYGDLIAINKDSSEAWRTQTNIPLRSAPVVDKNKVFVVNVSNEVMCFDIKTGDIIWKHKGIREITGVLGFAKPVIYETLLIAPLTSGELVALNTKTGKKKWSKFITPKRYGNTTASFSDIDSQPIIKGDTIFVASNSGVLKGLDKNKDSRSWKQEINVVGDMAVAGDFLFLITKNKELVCLYGKTGGIKWKTQLPLYEDEEDKDGDIKHSAPVIVNGKIWVAGSDGALREYAASNGKFLGEKSIPDAIYNTPVIMSDGIYFVSKSAKLIRIK